MGSVPVTPAQRKFFRSAGEPSGELLVQPVSHIFEPDSDGHIERTGSKRKSEAAVQLPTRQRFVRDLQRRNTICQHRTGESTPSKREPACSEVDLLMGALVSR